MTDATIGWGAEFHLHNGTSLIELGEITAIGLPSPEVSDVEATHFKSPGKYREYIAGLIEAGEGTFEMNYVPGSTTDALIRTARDARTARAYMIVIPDGAGTWEIAGSCIVKKYEPNVPIDDRMTATLTVRFTGPATEEAGA